ncbi:MAG: hypothetical protein JW809_01555 [Pirellulales bacterium]|nr:hypothetical protein [Pirellulales bacterium]
MTPRQRILAALAHERPDRTPTDGWFHPEVVEMLKRHFRTTDWGVVERELGMDGWADLAPDVCFPDFEARAATRPGLPDGRRAIWIDRDTYEDAWGTRYRLGDDGRYSRWLAGPLVEAETAADVAAYRFPTPEDVRDPEDYARRVAEHKAQGRFVCGEVDNPFKRFWHLRGFENVLMDYLANEEVIEAGFDPLFALVTELCLRMARSGVDMIKVVGDVSMQDRIMMGPAPWRRFDKPRWARLIETVRLENPRTVFFFHSDGCLTDLVGDLIDVGFTVINPIQPECMDPIEVKRRWGERITMHGGVSIQKTLPFGTPEDVRAEVETLIRHCGARGGLVVMPSNCVQPDTPVENILACYRAAREFDLAGL